MSREINELAQRFVTQPTEAEIERTWTDENFLSSLRDRCAREMEAASHGAQTALNLVDCVRYMNPNPAMARAFVGTLTRYTHRQLQNYVFYTLILPLIKEWAKQADEGDFDARNEFAVKLCKRWIEVGDF